jgi:tripeptide aminopeptidase
VANAFFRRIIEITYQGGNVIKADINKKRLLETFIELLSINSPSFQEKEIGPRLAKKLKDRGCRVTIQKYDKSFNLIATKKGTVTKAHPLLLSGHMDTIEPTEDIKFSIQRDSIRSTGSTVLGADDKSALAQILEALAVLQERALPHGDIEIVFTSAEEKGLHGSKAWISGKSGADSPSSWTREEVSGNWLSRRLRRFPMRCVLLADPRMPA